VHFDLNDELFIGGVPRLMHRQAARASLKSRSGLQGCVASVTLNGQTRNIADLTSFDIPEDSVGQVVAGCDGTLLCYVVIMVKSADFQAVRFST
jgi:hypothetical protein